MENPYSFRDYQTAALGTAVYPRPLDELSGTVDQEIIGGALEMVPIFYCALGLAGEAGEVADEIKKAWRNDMELTDSRKEKIKAELGDVLWYIANLATELDMDLETIAEENIGKLAARQARGALKTR